MTKTEYNNWVTNTYLTANSYKNSGKINVLFNGDKTLVMIIDLTTMVTRSEIIKNDNTREAVAIAFTRLKGEKVPKITNAPEYERVPYGSNYYTIVIKDGRMFTDNYAEMNDEYDANCFETNNYFHTEERAKEVLDKIKMLLRLDVCMMLFALIISHYIVAVNINILYLIVFQKNSGKYLML